MFDSCELRVHPTGKALARFGTKSQGQAHETTYAQIIAEELGIPAAHIQVEEGDTDGHTVTPSPHHPLGAKGVGESATVGAPPAIVNAVVDALSHLGVRHIDIPITPEKVWRILKDKGVAE